MSVPLNKEERTRCLTSSETGRWLSEALISDIVGDDFEDAIFAGLAEKVIDGKKENYMIRYILWAGYTVCRTATWRVQRALCSCSFNRSA